MIDAVSLGRRVRQLRELREFSLSALADEAGVSKSYLAKLEQGEIDNPGIRTLQSIAVALDATLADLLPSKPPAKSDIAEHERRLAKLPQGLKKFLAAKKEEGDAIPADIVKLLASIQFRGKRPRTEADWRFVYDAIRRSL